MVFRGKYRKAGKYRGVKARGRPQYQGRYRRPGLITAMRFKNPIHFFKRTLNASDMAGVNFAGSSSSGTTFSQGTGDCLMVQITNSILGSNYASFSLAFALSDLPNYSEFTALFDRYRIRGVSIKLIPQGTQSTAAAGSNSWVGQICHSVTDYDDNTNFAASDAGLNLMRQYESYQCKQLSTQKLKYYVKPRVAIATYGGSVFTSYGNVRDLWIDAASTGVPHYGKKFMIEVISNSANQVVNVMYKLELSYYIQCKDLR